MRTKNLAGELMELEEACSVFVQRATQVGCAAKEVYAATGIRRTPMLADVKCLLTADGTPRSAKLIIDGPDGPVDLTELGIVTTVDIHVDNQKVQVSFTCTFWESELRVEGQAGPPKGLDELARAYGYSPPEASDG